jgi:hypothetical protein
MTQAKLASLSWISQATKNFALQRKDFAFL